MDSLAPVKTFCSGIENDPRIRITHMALFLALYHEWVKREGVELLTISTKDLMLSSKISSSATYYATLKSLSEYGYIRYYPSFNNRQKSRVGL